MSRDLFTVGREAQLAEIEAVTTSVKAGVGSLLILIGEAGIGKSHLLDAAAASAKAKGLNVVALRVTEVDEYEPFGVLVRLGALVSIVAPDNTSSEVAWSQYTRRVFVSLASSPSLLLFDDMQWWDPQSARRALHLVEYAKGLGLGVIAASRPVAKRADGIDTSHIRALSRLMNRVQVEGLSEVEMATLVEHEVGVEVSTDTQDTLSRLTGGNPFFVLELARSAKSIDSIETMSLPREVTRLLDFRLDLLGAHEPFVALCAIFSGDVSRSVLADANTYLNFKNDDVEAAVRHADDLGILRVNRDTVLFRHALYSMYLVSRLSYAQRCEFHAAAAQALAKDHLFGQAMIHVIEAGKALPFDAGIGIASESLRVNLDAHNPEGVRVAAAWLITQEGIDKLERATYLSALGGAQISLGERSLGRKNAQLAAELARELGNPELEALALIHWSGRQDFTPDREPLLVAFGRVNLDALTPDTRVRLLCCYTHAIANVPTRGRISVHPQGASPDTTKRRSRQEREMLSVSAHDWVMNTTEARDLARRARSEAEANESGAISGEALVRSYLAWRVAHLSPEFLDERLTAMELSMTLAPSLDPEQLFSARYCYIVDLWEAGEHARADAELRIFRQALRESVDFVAQWRTDFIEAARELSHGHFEAASELSTTAYRSGELADEPGRLMVVLEQQIVIAQERGISPDMLAIMNKEIPLIGNAYSRSSAALVNAAAGEYEKCNQYLDSALDVFDDPQREIAWISTVANLVEAAHLNNRPEVARRGVELLQPFQDRDVIFLGNNLRGPVRRYLALARYAAGDTAGAIKDLLRARDASRTSGQELSALAAEVDLLEILCVEDPNRALETIDIADVVKAEQSEMKWRAARLRSAFTKAQMFCAMKVGLDEREFHVLRGLSHDQTIQEIGDELGFSHSTVRKTSMKIYKVLQVAGRDEAVAKARRLKIS